MTLPALNGLAERKPRRAKINEWAKEWVGLILVVFAVVSPALTWLGGKLDGPGHALAVERSERIHNDSTERADRMRADSLLGLRIDTTVHLMAEHMDTVRQRRIDSDIKDRIFYGFMCDYLSPQRQYDNGIIPKCALMRRPSR